MRPSSTVQDGPLPSMSDDQAAHLAALSAGAQMTEPGPGATSDEMSGAPVPDLAMELTGIIGAVVAAVSPALPSLRGIYTEEVTKAAAASIAGVCVKHGWLSGGLMGEYAEELTCLMVCAPLAMATVQGVKADLAKMKEKNQPAVGAGFAPVAVPPAPTMAEGEASPAPVVLQRG